MKRAIIYLRTSSNRQLDNTSLETQEQICRTYCNTEQLEVVEVIRREAVSAKETNIARAAEMLEFCNEKRKRFDVLVVYKLDRFARSQEQHHWLRNQIMEMGINVRSATERIDESPSGKLVEGVLAAVNEYDNAVRRERVKLAMWRLMDEGIYAWGRPPLGYKREKKVDRSDKLKAPTLDESCAADVRKMFELYSTGLYSFQGVADYFKNRPIINWRGKQIPIMRQFVPKVISSIFYTGYMENSQQQIIKGQHPALISMELFEKCQEVRDCHSKGREVKRQKLNPDFPLRKFVRCGECKKYMSAAWSTGRSKKYGYYHCATKGCSQYRKSVAKAQLEDEFFDHLASIRPDARLIELFKELFVTKYEEKMEKAKEASNRVHDEIQKIRDQRQWLVQKGMEGIIGDDFLKEQLKELDDKLLRACLNIHRTVLSGSDWGASCRFSGY